MKAKTKKIALISFLFFGCYALALTQSELNFVITYSVDPEIKVILDKHHQEIIQKLDRAKRLGRKQHEAWTFPWLPGYFVKLNLDRIYGMERMRRAIKKHNLDLLMLPDKRIYHVKGRPDAVTSSNYVIVVKKIETDPHRKPLTLRHVQQLEMLMRETEYISLTADNYIRTYQDKLALIDTESNFDRKQLLSKGYIRLIGPKHKMGLDFTQEAAQHLLVQMAMLLARYKGFEAKKLYDEIKGILKNPENKQVRHYVDFFEHAYTKVRR